MNPSPDFVAGIARLGRELHAALAELQLDGRLAEMAGSQLPDACSRLDYVLKVTEQAAHRTLDLVDDSRLLADGIVRAAADLADARIRALRYASSPVAIEGLADSLLRVSATLANDSGLLRENLTHLAQAQEYQDLAGQTIKRVIGVVRNIERALADLLDAAGTPLLVMPAEAPGGLQGPAISADKGASQTDADELLANLDL